MKKFKKAYYSAVCAILAIVMVFALAACNTGNKKTEDNRPSYISMIETGKVVITTDLMPAFDEEGNAIEGKPFVVGEAEFCNNVMRTTGMDGSYNYTNMLTGATYTHYGENKYDVSYSLSPSAMIDIANQIYKEEANPSNTTKTAEGYTVKLTMDITDYINVPLDIIERNYNKPFIETLDEVCAKALDPKADGTDYTFTDVSDEVFATVTTYAENGATVGEAIEMIDGMLEATGLTVEDLLLNYGVDISSYNGKSITTAICAILKCNQEANFENLDKYMQVNYTAQEFNTAIEGIKSELKSLTEQTTLKGAIGYLSDISLQFAKLQTIIECLMDNDAKFDRLALETVFELTSAGVIETVTINSLSTTKNLDKLFAEVLTNIPEPVQKLLQPGMVGHIAFTADSSINFSMPNKFDYIDIDENTYSSYTLYAYASKTTSVVRVPFDIGAATASVKSVTVGNNNELARYDSANKEIVIPVATFEGIDNAIKKDGNINACYLSIPLTITYESGTTYAANISVNLEIIYYNYPVLKAASKTNLGI